MMNKAELTESNPREPISLPIIGKHPQGLIKSAIGRLYVGPDTLEGMKSFSTKRRRLILYPGDIGKYPIPEEWRKEGVTVIGRSRGGPNSNSYVYYEILEGKVEI
jgi:hypothetical protein